MQPISLVRAGERRHGLRGRSFLSVEGIGGRRKIRGRHCDGMGGLLQCLQLLAWLEAHGLSRRNRDFRAGTRVAPDARLAGLPIKNAETAQLDAVALLQSLLHGLEDSLDGHLRLRLRDARPIDYFINDVQLDQISLLQRHGASWLPLTTTT